MKLSPIPQNVLEWIGLKAGMVPTPLAYAHFGFIMSKVVLEATDKGIFEAVGNKKMSVEQLATSCKLDVRALKSVLGVLASLGLVALSDEKFSLTKQSKKWLLKDSPHSLYWLLMFDSKVCYNWMDHVGSFLQTGKGLQYHETFTDEEWFYYQKAMEATAMVASREAVNKIPVPVNAKTLLDIGGSHGLYSLALCKKHKGLEAVIFDLPGAVEKSTPILNKHNTGYPISHIAGNILSDDIGEARYDVVLMASVAHHLTAQENMMVANKVMKTLKPGGYFTIIEALRPGEKKLNGDMLASLADFFFSLSSTSGTWSLSEIKEWQKQAGFVHYKKSGFLTIPGYTAITAVKK